MTATESVDQLFLHAGHSTIDAPMPSHGYKYHTETGAQQESLGARDLLDHDDELIKNAERDEAQLAAERKVDVQSPSKSGSPQC